MWEGQGLPGTLGDYIPDKRNGGHKICDYLLYTAASKEDSCPHAILKFRHPINLYQTPGGQ